jgi:hypothetical protein
MSDTFITYSLSTPAYFTGATGGLSNPSLTGSYTIEFDPAGQVIGITNVDLTATTSLGGVTYSTHFTDASVGANSIDNSQNPGAGGNYQILLNQGTGSDSNGGTGGGGPFSGLFLDFDKSATQFNTTGPTYSSVTVWTGSGFEDLSMGTNTPGAITPTPTCYCDGTRLLTTEGEIKVEDLAVGQMLVTASGAQRPIRWIGYRKINMRLHPEPDLVQPIRIAAGALAEGVPTRDLLVSPDHGMLVDGALIPARLLVNHSSITLDDSQRVVTYYHIELDQHDVVMAEGAPSESYLDTGNRDTFENAPVTTMKPDMSVAQRLRMPSDGACMPLVTDTDSVLPVWQRLADRAGTSAAEAEMAVAGAEDGGVRLVVGGRTVRPVVEQGGRLIFALPRDAGEVRLVSGAARPNKARPWLDDRRLLSVAVKDVVADQKAIALDGPAFGTGWWDIEAAGPASFRWSNGDAKLTLPKGTKLLTIRLHAAMPEAAQTDRALAA